MLVSVFRDAWDSVPKAKIMTWDEFADNIGPHDFSGGFTDKRECPAFSPAEWRSGAAAKTGRDVVRVHFGVLDLDKISYDQVCHVVELCDGLNAVLLSSWSHAEEVQKTGLWRMRLCVEFDRPIEAAEWARSYPGFVTRFGGLADVQTKDLNRIYFGAFAPPGTERFAVFLRFRGAPLAVGSLGTASAVLAANVATGTDVVTRERLARLAARWRRSRSESEAERGETLRKICGGEVYADPGERDDITYRICAAIAAAMPTAAPSSIARHFAQSLQLMEMIAPGAPTIENVTDKIERCIVNTAAEEIAEEEEKLTDHRLRIRQAFAHIDPTRITPYTERELDDMARKIKATRDEMAKRWIIQRGNIYYTLAPGGAYSNAYTENDIANALPRDLAPATSAGVDIWTATRNGDRIRKTLPSLMFDYGTVAQDYVLDLRAQESTYEASQKLFIEAPAPLRKLDPEYHHGVNTWLWHLTGDAFHDVCTWIACLTDLNETAAALMFTGPGNTGKSLFAEGLARLWSTTGATKLASAIDPNFNEVLSRNPFVFGDEYLPTDWRGQGRTQELREFIAARSRPHKKKFHPETRLLGAIRLFIAANNDNILTIKENLTSNDIEAIADRFYRVKVQKEARDYLRTQDVATWVHTDAIARHALWLRDNHKFEKQGRFIIKSTDTSFHYALTTKTGIRSALCQWLLGYLKDPRRIDATASRLVRIKDGRLLVTWKGIADYWDAYVINEDVPKTGPLNEAINGLCNSEKIQMRNGTSTPQRYRVVDIHHLYAWAEDTEFSTREDIDAVLAVDTETRLGVK